MKRYLDFNRTSLRGEEVFELPLSLKIRTLCLVKIIVAPTSFKGSLSPTEATEAMARGVRRVLPDAEIVGFPLSDGGEGFAEVLVGGSAGRFYETEVDGPLTDQRVRARWGILGDQGTSVIEMATASGLSLVPEEKRDPKITSTFGVGQLIKAALDRGARKIVIGIGGSATNDGGAGMAQALDVRLLQREGLEIGRGGASLRELHQIDISWRDRRIRAAEFIVASGVTNPLCGPEGASAVYGPQKGATESDVELLDQALQHYALLIKRDIGIDVAGGPGGGAAGGLGAGCLVFLNAKNQSGVEFVLNELHFDEKLRDASLVITGEGRLDEQTVSGKAITGVAKRAAPQHVPVVAIAGSIEGDPTKLERALKLEKLYSLCTNQITREEAIRRAEELLFQRVTEVITEHSKSRAIL